MKAALQNLIATLEHVVQSLNEDRDHDYVKENPREYDEFIHDLGKDRMKDELQYLVGMQTLRVAGLRPML